MIIILIVQQSILPYYLDIHQNLFQFLNSKVYIPNFIKSFDSSVSSITIPNNNCNDVKYTIFDFSRFTLVESIEIGNNCFGSVQTLRIDGLNRLRSIKIGNNSFTQEKKNKGGRTVASKSFHILNCESLESIHIGEYSFSDFGGEFELKNLPQLQSIQIGTVGNESCNFCGSSFVIRGIEYDIENLNE